MARPRRDRRQLLVWEVSNVVLQTSAALMLGLGSFFGEHLIRFPHFCVGPIPEALGVLKQLRTLELKCNKITGKRE